MLARFRCRRKQGKTLLAPQHLAQAQDGYAGLMPLNAFNVVWLTISLHPGERSVIRP